MSRSPALQAIAGSLCLFLTFLAAGRTGLGAEVQPGAASDRVRTEIPYQGGTVVLLSDFQERMTKTRYRAAGHVEISYQDILITTDEAEYDESSQTGFALGNTRFSQKKQWLTCSRAEFNLATQTGTFYDASGFTDRDFFVKSRTIIKTGPDTYSLETGFVTACNEPKPKWAFTSSRTNIRIDRTARMRNMIFKVKGIPVFYAPYLVVPMEGKKRSSGLIPFHTGSSTSKGRVFSEGYYQTLGPSADVTLYGDYFTLRGLAWGGIFRARPNPATHLYLQAFGIHDKLGQGGAQLVIDGDTKFWNDFRAVARVNITSSFDFRQAFSDSFRSATIPQERATAFLTRNQGSLTTNLAYQREEVFFPTRSVVIRKFPSVEYSSMGMPLGNSPFVFSFRSAYDGLSRSDQNVNTQNLVHRIDLFPRIAVRSLSLAGFTLMPSIGLRETYYSARWTDTPVPQILNQGLNRRYVALTLDLRTPTFEKDYQDSWLGSFKHVIEPIAVYRRIAGIDHERETIRFDSEDAIADTSEIEYGIVNRIFKSTETSPGMKQQFEFMSFSVMQKYYFDPSFGGAFQNGTSNLFYPLNTLTGYAATGLERSFAPISMDLRWSPKGGISHDLRADFDTKLKEVRDVSLSTYFHQGNTVIAGSYLRTWALDPGTFQADHIQGQVGYGSTKSGLSASATLSYNIQAAKLLNSNTRLNYMWDCCGLAMEFQQYSLGLRTESRFSFSFTLKGLGSFGNIKRPESLF
jgi:LPS-assembly protein